MLLPGADFDANWITRLISGWVAGLQTMMEIPPGNGAAIRAISEAFAGNFVLAAISADELNAVHAAGNKTHPQKLHPMTKHLHVAIVVSGIGNNGWPLGYWKGGATGKKKSLSLSFPAGAANRVHYFVVWLSDPRERLL